MVNFRNTNTVFVKENWKSLLGSMCNIFLSLQHSQVCLWWKRRERKKRNINVGRDDIKSKQKQLCFSFETQSNSQRLACVLCTRSPVLVFGMTMQPSNERERSWVGEAWPILAKEIFAHTFVGFLSTFIQEFGIWWLLAAWLGTSAKKTWWKGHLSSHSYPITSRKTRPTCTHSTFPRLAAGCCDSLLRVLQIE